jgi:fructoselysine-6-P-deglycase FrlB-like protein
MVFLKKVSDSMNMKEEMEEQGTSINLTIKSSLDDIKRISNKVKYCENFVFSGCGDKYIVPLATEYLWNHVSEKPLKVIQSWTLRNYPPSIINDKSCVVFISQSGTTHDTVQAFKSVLKNNCSVIVITNLKEEKSGSLVDLCENYKKGHVIRIHTKEYPEKSLPSTGSFHSSLVVLNLLTIFINGEKEKFIDLHINYIPKVVDELSRSDKVKNWALQKAELFRKFNNFYVVGDGPRYPAAKKHAKIMMMEGSKTNACDVEGEEFVHSLIETLEFKTNPLILLKPMVEWNSAFKNFQMIEKFWKENTRKNKLLIVDPFEFIENKMKFLFSGIEGDILSPFFYMPQLEWFSYYLGLKKGFDPSVGKLVKKVRSQKEIRKLLT